MFDFFKYLSQLVCVSIVYMEIKDIIAQNAVLLLHIVCGGKGVWLGSGCVCVGVGYVVEVGTVGRCGSMCVGCGRT